jgi:hypothetical protein
MDGSVVFDLNRSFDFPNLPTWDSTDALFQEQCCLRLRYDNFTVA